MHGYLIINVKLRKTYLWLQILTNYNCVVTTRHACYVSSKCYYSSAAINTKLIIL